MPPQTYTLAMLRTTKWLLAFVLCNTTAHAQYSGAKPAPDDLKPGFDAVQVDDAKRILTYLATQCEGRGTGQRGFDKAARFVANEFKRIGLKPLGDNGTYFQRASVTTGLDLRVEFRGLGGTVEFGAKDFSYLHNNGFRFEGPTAMSGLPTFIEYGGKPGKLPEPDQLKGRIVFFHFPDNHGDDSVDWASLDKFFDGLAKTPPAAFFGVQDDFEAYKKSMDSNGLFHGPHWNLADGPPEANQAGNGNVSGRAFPAIVNVARVGKLDAARPGSVAVTLGMAPMTCEIKGKVENVRTENVVGLLEGSDPALKAEYVVVGGHLDHWGIQNGLVYPGADDDGSGATDVIEAAKAVMANPMKPRRSIIFITFFGEEQGLLGSRYFANHPPVPLAKIVAELEMDMVARDSEGDQQDDEHKRVDKASENVDTIRVVGSKRISTDIDRDVQDSNAFVNFRLLYDSESVYGRSDDYVFAHKGIPTAWLFSGFHPDYHQTTDTVDKIDWLKLTNTAKLMYLTAHRIADADAAPKKDVVPGRGSEGSG